MPHPPTPTKPRTTVARATIDCGELRVTFHGPSAEAKADRFSRGAADMIQGRPVRIATLGRAVSVECTDEGEGAADVAIEAFADAVTALFGAEVLSEALNAAEMVTTVTVVARLP